MSPDAAALWILPAHVFKWIGLLGGLVALCGLLCLVHALRTAGEETDEEMSEDDL